MFHKGGIQRTKKITKLEMKTFSRRILSGYSTTLGSLEKIFFTVKVNKSLTIFEIARSSRPEVFYRKGVLRNFTKFAGKHLCQSLFFNKVNFAKFLRTHFFAEHLRWLLLNF